MLNTSIMDRLNVLYIPIRKITLDICINLIIFNIKKIYHYIYNFIYHISVYYIIII